MKKILFTGGGSAGHVVPNLALIEQLLATGEADICYLGSNAIEKRLVAPLKIPYYEIAPPKLVRAFSLRNFLLPFAFQKAVKDAEKGLRAFRPDVVFSKGGYVALPVVFAAKRLKIPCLTHESDLSAGLANRLMANKCERVLTSFPETAERFRRGKFVGSPMRAKLFGIDRNEAKKKYGFSGERKVVLLFGGGSGSAFLNETLRKHLPVLCKRYDILHLCGKGNATPSRFEGYRQIEYEDDMGSAYAAADLVVCRAGSNTAFEVVALKKKAILVPLEGQTRGDQKQNAAYFQKRGLVRVLREADGKYFPEAIDDAFLDEKLEQKLLSSTFSSGTQNILNELRRYLS